MRLLVASASYPNLEGGIALAYIHTRNKYYQKQGIEVNVLNFSAKEDYIIDGIKVYTLNSIKNKLKEEDFDILVCHAPNIRNHYLFLKRYHLNFPKLLFVFHGHEVLNINKVYSKPFSYVRKSKIKIIGQEVYDIFKLNVWKRYLPKIVKKSYFMFVSKWMYIEFLKWTKIPQGLLKDRYSITYNCVGQEFESMQYEFNSKKEFDLITIRGNLDGSKYCIDIVNELAKANKNLKFLVIGKGEYFSKYDKAKNITWIDAHLSHNQIVEYLSKTRCALMPTRTDAQGLMACEMATYGMPLITSDITVCEEIFSDFINVSLINNEETNINLDELIVSIEQKCKDINIKNSKYFNENTSGEEVSVFKKIIKG